MAITISHFCVLLLCLACIGMATGRPGYRPPANNEHGLLHRTGDPSFDSDLGSYLDRTPGSSPSQHAFLPRLVPIEQIFDYCRVLLDTIRNPFTGKQVWGQSPSKAEHDHNVLFVFGDSLFDAGNNKYINDDSYAPSHYPYGYTYFTYATGRRCEGRIVPDFIAEYAQLPLIPPSMQPGADFTYGANFASAGSAVLDSDGESDINVISLKEQLMQFKEMAGKFNETLGPRRAGEMLRKAVYLFSIGGNDYLNYYKEIIEEGRVPTQAEQHQFVKEIVGNTTNAIKEIYKLGARKIAFQSVGPMGCLPVVETLYPELNGSCASELLTMPLLHNEELYRALSDLAESLEGFKFSVMDYFSSLYDRIMDPSNYGFDVGRTQCYRSEGDAFRGAKGCAGANYILCDYPSGYVFFDDGHTTQSANAQLAKIIWSGDPSVTRPYNVQQLFEED